METGVPNCIWVGNFSGLAGLFEDATDPDELVISVDDDAITIGFVFIRQSEIAATLTSPAHRGGVYL
jgi:hypothetical protein